MGNDRRLTARPATSMTGSLLMQRQMQFLLEQVGESRAVTSFRKMGHWYLKAMRVRADLRNDFQTVEDVGRDSVGHRPHFRSGADARELEPACCRKCMWPSPPGRMSGGDRLVFGL